MAQRILDANFDLDEISELIQSQISQWRCHKITLDNLMWEIIDHDGKTVYRYFFNINFDDIEARIKIEDLRLNIIYFINSLKDDTTYDYYLKNY